MSVFLALLLSTGAHAQEAGATPFGGSLAEPPIDLSEDAPIVVLPPLRVLSADELPRRGFTTEELAPPEAKAMLASAFESGNEQEVAIVVKYASRTWPTFDQFIRQREADWKAARARARETTIREARFFDLWDGRGELGGFLTTGNSENVGVSAAVNIRREGLRWRHRLFANADYQESFGRTSRERYVLGYEPNYKFDDRLFAYGALLYEQDRFLGYDDRFSASAGIGYGVIRRANVRLDLTAGPAYRFTAFTDDSDENSFGGRASIDFNWRLSPGVRFTQVAATYVQPQNSTITATSALEARLLGPLSARLSYNVQYESDPTLPRRSTDTITRASLVYDF